MQNNANIVLVLNYQLCLVKFMLTEPLRTGRNTKEKVLKKEIFYVPKDCNSEL